jgi:hypothetical protein
MGRPLNKKYFGNRNTGSASVTTDDGIGGGAVASVTLNALGSYTTRATITFANTPKLPGGVRATGTITSEALSAVATVGGTGYLVGDLLTVTTAGGSAIAYVATLSGDGSTGEVATVNFTGTGASRGSFEALATGAQATTDNSVAGAGCTLTITYRAKAVVITEAGSGYTSAPAATFTESVTATSVNMLVDSGNVGATTNQENAIQMTAFLPDGSAVAVDILKQVSTDRYKVTDGTRTGIVELTSTLADAAGEASIAATDSAGGEYFVTKLTARRATVTRAGGSGWLYADNESAPWKFDAPATIYLQIANA